MDIDPPGTSDASRVRHATSSDIEALSHLVVQLYAAELPRMFRGSAAGQTEVVRRLVANTPLTGRYVLTHDGGVAASGSLATSDAPRPSTPPGTLLALPSILGVRASLATFTVVLRAMLTVATPPGPDEAQIHSVVVDDRHRGAGSGTRMMRHLEAEAAASGKRRAVLQVLESNSGARAFYRALGYLEDGPAHRRPRSLVAFPSVLMHKDLAAPG